MAAAPLWPVGRGVRVGAGRILGIGRGAAARDENAADRRGRAGRPRGCARAVQGMGGSGAPCAGRDAAGLPVGGHRVEATDDLLKLANGRAQARREQGVLGCVFGEGRNQDGDDRGERLA